MAELFFAEPALEQLDQLQADTSRWPVLDAIDDALDQLAADPDAVDHRRRRFQRPPAWMIPVATPDGPWMILWVRYEAEDAPPGAVHVLYVGPIVT